MQLFFFFFFFKRIGCYSPKRRHEESQEVTHISLQLTNSCHLWCVPFCDSSRCLCGEEQHILFKNIVEPFLKFTFLVYDFTRLWSFEMTVCHIVFQDCKGQQIHDMFWKPISCVLPYLVKKVNIDFIVLEGYIPWLLCLQICG